jgi:hypothetical protein
MPRPAPRVAPATTATRPASGLLATLRSLTTRFAVGVFARGIRASFDGEGIILKYSGRPLSSPQLLGRG